MPVERVQRDSRGSRQWTHVDTWEPSDESPTDQFFGLQIYDDLVRRPAASAAGPPHLARRGSQDEIAARTALPLMDTEVATISMSRNNVTLIYLRFNPAGLGVARAVECAYVISFNPSIVGFKRM